MRHHQRITASLAAACGVIGISAFSASAQSWMAGGANTNMNGTVWGLKMWDPDGAGPQAPVLVATGNFTAAGTASPATRAATWDGTSWSALGGGGGPDASVQAVTSLSSNNSLYFVSTGMATANGVSARKIAGWNGSEWFGLGTGEGNIPSLSLTSVSSVNADTIVFGGSFMQVGDVTGCNRIATYNTTTGFAPLGPGLSSIVFCVYAMSNQNIIASGGGDFTGDNAVTINRIARWDGTAWNPMGNGFLMPDGSAGQGLARCMLELPNGDLVVGGSFLSSGTTVLNKIGRWDHVANTWHPYGAGFNTLTSNSRDVYALALMPNGDIVAGGDFNTAEGAPQNYIARWSASTSTWGPLAPGALGMDGPVRSLAVLPNGDLAVGGDFLNAGGQPAQRFAIWDEPSAATTPPTITQEPVSQVVAVTATAQFTLTATGTGPLTYRWQQQDLFDLPNFVDIDDGPVFDPFFNAIATASGAHTNQLTLSDLSGVAQIFRCVVTNAHGTDISAEVTLSFPEPCPADFNGDTFLSIDDLFLYFNAYFSNDASADFNGNDGVTIDDLFLYINAYFTGC